MNTWFKRKSLLVLAAAVLLLGALAACGYEEGTEPGFDEMSPGGEMPAAPGGDAGLGTTDDVDNDDSAADSDLDEEDDDEEDSDQ